MFDAQLGFLAGGLEGVGECIIHLRGNQLHHDARDGRRHMCMRNTRSNRTAELLRKVSQA